MCLRWFWASLIFWPKLCHWSKLLRIWRSIFLFWKYLKSDAFFLGSFASKSVDQVRIQNSKGLRHVLRIRRFTNDYFRQTLPEVQNRGISGPTKRICVLQKYFFKKSRQKPWMLFPEWIVEINYLFTDTACLAIVVSLKLNVRNIQRKMWEAVT